MRTEKTGQEPECEAEQASEVWIGVHEVRITKITIVRRFEKDPCST
jgi:hypothetical protein